MKKYIDPKMIAIALGEIYGNGINENVSDFPSDRTIKDESAEKIIARQFMFVYNTVNAEKINPELIVE